MVHFGRRCRPSATALKNALREAGYDGRDINFGYGIESTAVNKPEAIANSANKRTMRRIFSENEVPMPRLVSMHEALNMDSRDDVPTTLVGRPDTHRQGRGFWLCRSERDVRNAIAGRRRERGRRGKRAASHFMEYINAEKEFRVHVVNGESIKISEKVGGDATVKSHGRGAIFQYPYDFHHKITLRRAAKKAVEVLGLDFGAVDVLWANDQAYVLEVNSAPCLTDENSDTLERYVRAFVANYSTEEDDDYDEDWDEDD